MSLQKKLYKHKSPPKKNMTDVKRFAFFSLAAAVSLYTLRTSKDILLEKNKKRVEPK